MPSATPAEALSELLERRPRARAGLDQSVAGLFKAVFEQVVGFDTSTTSIKSVHFMNDLAQLACGGLPSHEGDLLCMIIRPPCEALEGKISYTDRELRAEPIFGGSYSRAFPERLGPQQTQRLREALRLLLNNDGGMYLPRTKMASGLATHWSLLGAEGNSRLGLGSALAELVGAEGRARLEALLRSKGDPVSRAVAPLLSESEVIPRPLRQHPPAWTALDECFGRRLQNLLQHSLSKPTALRALSLAASVWFVLKVFGAGKADGRPRVLALTEHWRERRPGLRNLRQEASASYALCLGSLDHRVGELLETALGASELGPLKLSGPEAISALREKSTKVYWPDEFAAALGRRAGFVQPKKDQGGWGKHLCLTGDLLEALLLMYSDPGGERQSWRSVWEQVSDELGLVIGARPYQDDNLLSEAGMTHLPGDALLANSEDLLECAVARGLARRLPDSQAEVGAALT